MKGFTDYLSQFKSERRLKLLREILTHRTRYLTVVLEDIYQPQNTSAVIRSCDAFGIQDVHIIENLNEYRINPRVTHGCDKWMSLYRYNLKENNTTDALLALKKNNYRIIATSPDKNYKAFSDLDMKKGKIAVFFGTEGSGLSEEVLNEADEMIHIPMYGFSESLNLSVSAALILWNCIQRLRSSDINWQLDSHDAEAIYLEWLKKNVKTPEIIERDFLGKNHH